MGADCRERVAIGRDTYSDVIIPRKRMIQYAAAYRLDLASAEYWMPAGACHRAAIRPTRWRA
jgi:hypothetical protein